MHIRKLTLTLIVLSCSSGEQQQEQQQGAQATAVTLEEFRQLQWIAGTWRGSGGAYPAFFEEYRIVDDSTIQMRAFSDSTLSVTTDSSWIEFRNGAVNSRGGGRTNIVVALAADSVRFAQPGATQGGHTFTRTSPDEWIATLHPSQAGGQATVYIMRRIQR